MASQHPINKVFGLGLTHTATSSLSEALNTLGIRSIHYPLDRRTYRELSRGTFELTLLRRYQAITDITVAPYYPQLDRAYPGSKFILTVREKGAWLRSMARRNEAWRRYAHENLFVRCSRMLRDEWQVHGLGAVRSTWSRIRDERIREFYRVATYGVVAFSDAELVSSVYDRHRRNVLEYFEGRPDDVLVLDITSGEGWEKLCPFLGRPIPAEPFPHVFDRKYHGPKEPR